MNKEQLISEILMLPISAMEYHLSEHLIQLFPDRALLEGDVGQFNLEGYAAANLCVLTRKTFLYNQMKTYWRAPEPEMMHPQQYGRMPRGSFTVRSMQQPLPENVTSEDAGPATADAVSKAWFDVQWQGQTLEVLILSCLSPLKCAGLLTPNKARWAR